MADTVNPGSRTTASGLGYHNSNLIPIESPKKEAIPDNKPQDNLASSPDTVEEDAEDEEIKALRDYKKTREPLYYCKLVTKYPKTSFGITLSAHTTMFLLMGILYVSGYNILPIDFENLPLDIKSNEFFQRGIAWDYKDQRDQTIKRGESDAEIQDERSEQQETIMLVFESKGGNIFTQNNLQSMQSVEDDLFNIASFQNSFCHTDSNGECNSLVSILRFFDGTFSSIDSAFDDSTYSNVEDVIYKASYYNETKVVLSNLLDVNSVVSVNESRATVLRSYMSIGYPLQGFNNTRDRVEEQESKIEKFLTDDFIPVADSHFKRGAGSLNFLYNSGSILLLYIRSLVFQDMALVVGSFSFIFLFMWFQTGSLWITAFAIFSVVSGFCTTNLIYRIPLDFRYFGIFHVLALFIVLGIGADDVFVFFDTWKDSSHKNFLSLAHRLSYCYRQAALAMLYTSLTTAVAFIVSATSPFLSVSTFGIFAGILILINYISVVVYFPTVIVTYHLYFEKYKCCCCCPATVDKSEVKVCDNQSEAAAEEKTETTDIKSTDGKRKNPFVRFFRGPYYNFITHKIIRFVILGFYAIVIAISIYFATRLRPNEEQIKYLPSSTNAGQFLDIRATAFTTGDLPLRIFIVFGLKKQDFSPCHRTDSACFGDTIWDNNFEINNAENQRAVLNFCNTVLSISTEQADELFIRRDLVTGQYEVNCFLKDLQEFLETSTNVTSPSIPINQSQAEEIMNLAPHVYNQTQLGMDFDNWFEIVASYWLYNGFSSTDLSQDFLTYDPLLGEEETENTITETLDSTLTYKYGTKLKYAAVVVNTTINPRTLGFPKGLPIRDRWEQFVKSEVEDMPDGLKGTFHATPFDYWNFNLWHWMDIQRTLAVNAVIGIAVGLTLAMPILIIATTNIFVGLLATLTICCVTVSVVGIIPMVGWKLGILESLNLVLVVGLAVDYCVHLAEGYSRSIHKDRKNRLRDALEEVGISVLSGCCTTLGASFFLLFAQILFFTQFGAFMFCTLGFSILYSLGFFTTLLGILGPENNTGSITYLFRKCFNSNNKVAKVESDNKQQRGYAKDVNDSKIVQL